MRAERSSRLIAASGWLALVAGLGGAIVDPLWWALMPAAALLAAGLLMRPAFASHRLSRLGTFALAAALVASLGVTAVGLVTVARTGFEPAWVGRLTTWSGLAIVVAAAILGAGLAGRGSRSIALGAVVAGSLPLGILLDRVTSSVLPAGIFFADAGFTIGLLLFAIGLIRLGRRESQQGSRRRLSRHRRTSHRVTGDTLAANAP